MKKIESINYKAKVRIDFDAPSMVNINAYVEANDIKLSRNKRRALKSLSKKVKH